VVAPLADSCPAKEKAFDPATSGTVLGVWFDSEQLTWSLSRDKIEGIVQEINSFLVAQVCNLKQIQKLHGKLSDVAQMCSFLKGFRFQLVRLLGRFEHDESGTRTIPNSLKTDLWVWKKSITHMRGGRPLPAPPVGPPLTCLKFVSDAAGAVYEGTGTTRRNATRWGDPGVASLGYDRDGIWYIGGTKWPFLLMTKAKDSKGADFGSKSNVLEGIGLLLPFLTVPKQLRGRYVLLYVDNSSLIYAWEKRYCKNNEEASILIRTLDFLYNKRDSR